MSCSFILGLFLLLPLAGAPLSAGEINFVYPAQGAAIPDVPRTFVFGNISPATAAFTINGEKIAVHTNGGFIAWLPIAPGDFSFVGTLDDETVAQRTIKVKGLSRPKSDEDEVWLAINSLGSNIEVLPGEYVKIQASGAPGMEAVFSIAGMVTDEPMRELPAGSGRYSAAYRVKDSDAGADGLVSTRFKTGLFRSDAEIESKGRVKIVKNETLVETSTETVILRNAPDGGYQMILPRGVKLVSNGRMNGLRRIFLTPAETAWVDDSKVHLSPAGQFPLPPFTETGAIRLKRTDYGSQATVALYERVPFTAEETAGGLRLTLYYTNLHTNWVVYDSSDTFVKNVVFRQAGLNKAEIDFETGPEAVWGYNISYSGKSLLVELRRKPEPALTWPRPLAGISVIVDPGHSPKYVNPYDGAIGPKATFEFQVNLAIAQKLKEKLLTLGASVQMTRNGDENVPLADRPKMAKEMGGDIFISVHNNAIGDGEDPYAQPRGFQIYYYHRHSRDLGAAVHRAYLRNIPLPDEGLRYGDYLVARLTWMPAILTESAYMIFPNQEEMLNAPAFQDKLAQSMTEGVLEFFKVPPQSQKELDLAARGHAQPLKQKHDPAAKTDPASRAQPGPKETTRGLKSGGRANKAKNVRHN